MAAPRPNLEAVVLIAALIANIMVLILLDDVAGRLTLGLLLLAPIVWASARLGVVELDRGARTTGREARADEETSVGGAVLRSFYKFNSYIDLRVGVPQSFLQLFMDKSRIFLQSHSGKFWRNYLFLSRFRRFFGRQHSTPPTSCSIAQAQ